MDVVVLQVADQQRGGRGIETARRHLDLWLVDLWLVDLRLGDLRPQGLRMIDAATLVEGVLASTMAVAPIP
jgi:hypothetical protein